jgi:glutamate synthase domain-containing protein 1
VASGGARDAEGRGAWARRMAHAMSRRGGAAADNVTVYPCLKLKNSNFLNTSAQNFEYESCRSHYPYNFHKGHMGFFSTDFAKEACQL